jgi:uncharacterized protein YbcV (DUF1398 family)
MNVEVLQDTLAGTIAGAHSFPEVVRTLTAEGVESYRTDLVRMEATFYYPDGSTHLEKLALPAAAVAESFSHAGIVAATRAAQAGTVQYPEFVQRAMSAGAGAYVAYLRGRKVIYFGRNGDFHVEEFPAAKP